MQTLIFLLGIHYNTFEKPAKVRESCVAFDEPSTFIPPNCHVMHEVSQTIDKKDTGNA